MQLCWQSKPATVSSMGKTNLLQTKWALYTYITCRRNAAAAAHIPYISSASQVLMFIFTTEIARTGLRPRLINGPYDFDHDLHFDVPDDRIDSINVMLRPRLINGLVVWLWSQSSLWCPWRPQHRQHKRHSEASMGVQARSSTLDICYLTALKWQDACWCSKAKC